LRASQVIPLVEWYYGDSVENAARVNTAPCSWEVFDAFSNAENLPGYPQWKKYFNNRYVYKETEMGKETKSMGSSTYPLPLCEHPTKPPISARYLFGHVKRCFFKSASNELDLITTHYMTVSLNNRKGQRCGALNLLQSPDDLESGIRQKGFEVVAISRGELMRYQNLDTIGYRTRSRELHKWGNFSDYDAGTKSTHLGQFKRGLPCSIIEYYYVLWIEWEDGIAYRKGLGRILKDAWDREAGDEIDLVLG
jgi:hypothetical protein